MWARVHKIDRIRPLPNGGAIVLVEDERNASAMSRNAGLSTVIALARVINARRALEARFAGKGEIRYAAGTTPPPFMVDVITRAGASISDSKGERIVLPARPASVSSVLDQAMAELAHHIRTSHGMTDMAATLTKVENSRRKTPLDRDANPAAYWGAVFEIAALAGELSRARGGRWIEANETPVPFALSFPTGEQAVPTKLAQQIVEGRSAEEILAATAAAMAAEKAAATAAADAAAAEVAAFEAALADAEAANAAAPDAAAPEAEASKPAQSDAPASNVAASAADTSEPAASDATASGDNAADASTGADGDADAPPTTGRGR